MAVRDDTLPLPEHSGAFVLDEGAWPEGVDPGRYTYEVLLGRGGMGEVWQAQDQHLRRQVAIKKVRPGASAALQSRLKREARITAALEHPNIVTVHDAGTDVDGSPWFAMSIVRGRSLADALAEADPSERMGLVRHVLDACEAVAFAHHAGVVHRDLKPANLWVGAFGETQVMDWGLARTVDDEESSWDEVLSEVGTLTEVGVVLGTPAYMSPEQAAGERAGCASDVWSLGVVLWEVLAGERAFRGPSSQEILRRVLTSEPPPLAEVVPDVPAELAAIVERATRREPARRYPDAGALAADLQAFLDGRRVSAYRYTALDALQQTTRRARVGILAGAAGLAGLVLAGGIGLAFLVQEQNRLRQVEDALQDALATSDARLADALTQRALLALEGGDLGRAQLLAAEALTRSEDVDARGVLAEGSAHPRRLAHLPVSGCTVGTLAGAGLTCATDAGIRRIDLDGGSRLVSPHPAVNFVRNPWDPQVLADRGDGHLYLVHGAGGDVPDWRIPIERIYERWGPSLVPGTFIASHSLPDALIAGPGVDGRSGRLDGVVFADLCGGIVPRRAGLLAPDDVLVWCSDGTLRRGRPDGTETLTVIDGELPDSMALDLRGETVAFGEVTGGLRVHAIDGEQEPLLLDLGPARVHQVALSADGAWVAARVPGVGLHLVERATEQVHIVPTRARDVGFTRDGRLLVWTGAALETWALPEGDAPRVVSTGTSGVVSLAWYGERLTVTSGSGVSQVAPGELGEHRVLRGEGHSAVSAVKAAAQDEQGVLWVAALDGLFRWADEVEEVHDGLFRRVLPLADGHVLAAGRRNVLLRDGEELFSEPWFNAAEAARSPDGRTSMLISDDGRLARMRIGPPVSFEELGTVEGFSLAVADDGTAWIGTRDGIEVRDPSGESRSFATTGVTVLDLALSPDGRLLAAADSEQRVWVFRVSDGETLARLRGHSRRVGSVMFSADGRWLASGSWDDTVRFWDVSVFEAPAEALRERIEASWGVPAAELADDEQGV